ncbi:MAG: DUF499 domain-containing protein [Tissierella sp.]|nr:DUF499 domain-containing protein [Tissierella sp.]
MKTLYEVCKPRESVFDESKRDDTLDLSNLLDNSIDGEEFFKETYVTAGMELLFDTAFKRFEGKAASGVVKLTQSMGGGKTHNMLALGVLAKNKDLRSSILNGKYKNFNEEINLVSYTGRESDLKFGIWGEIAEQLGKKDYFKDYYSPLMAPGQTAWINLLKSDKPTLILIDELPPYLQNARAIPIGTGTLADITTTALSNLFNAVGKAELHNVYIVVSDLQATYEEGSQLLQRSFKELENEMGRSAINIEPVGANTDDLYNILRTRLFEEIGNQETINEVIEGYRKSINETRQMGYTNFTADEIARGIQASYPFHPSVRDLFARFKENPGFQQTRGYIRLTRLMVKDLYSGDMKAKERFLLNAYDINLNDGQTVIAVKGIKESISNAISHDIADGGNAVAEVLDNEIGNTDIQDISKLILVSSLGNVSNAIIGLSVQEIIGYMASPGKDITGLKQGLEEFSTKAWYLYKDKANRVYFKDIKNVNAELIDLVNSYSYEFGKQAIKTILEDKFKPEQKHCYQEVKVFPSIDEIDLTRDKITLVLTEPSTDSSGLNKDLKRFYEDSTYKNRVMFLTGQRNSMDNLVTKGKEYSGINAILNKMKNEEKIPETDPQYQQAQDLFSKVNLELISALRESFVTLYYPKRPGLVSDDITMKFEENNYVLEEQIKNLLIREKKFDTNTETNDFRGKFEDRIFTQRQMSWNAIKERTASLSSWSWHHPDALEDLKTNMLRRGEWVETGGYIDKEPPAPETSITVIQIHEDENTGEVTLKLVPEYGDSIYYEIGQVATKSSLKIEDIENFKTKELKLSFLCVDSKGKHETGAPVEWTKDVKLKYKPYDKDGNQYMELKATADNVKILYSTDGSNPRESGGVFEGDFIVPEGAKFIQAVAVNEALGIFSEPIQIEVKEQKFEIDKKKELKIIEPIIFNNATDAFKGLELLEQFNTSLSRLTLVISDDSPQGKGYIQFMVGGEFTVDSPKKILDELNNIIKNLFEDKEVKVNLTINEIIFETGEDFERWVSSKKEKIEDYKGKIRQ